MSDFDPNRGFVYRAQRVFLWIGALYATLLVLLVIPPVQRQYALIHFGTVPTRTYFDHDLLFKGRCTFTPFVGHSLRRSKLPIGMD
jgi:hypothetical protein